MKNKYYNMFLLFENQKYKFVISGRNSGKVYYLKRLILLKQIRVLLFVLKGGETMEDRNDMKRSSALKKFIYSQLDRLKGQAETPNADLKIIESKKNILEEIIKICENRGRY